MPIELFFRRILHPLALAPPHRFDTYVLECFKQGQLAVVNSVSSPDVIQLAWCAGPRRVNELNMLERLSRESYSGPVR